MREFPQLLPAHKGNIVKCIMGFIRCHLPARLQLYGGRDVSRPRIDTAYFGDALSFVRSRFGARLQECTCLDRLNRENIILLERADIGQRVA